jgi:urease accessory protein
MLTLNAKIAGGLPAGAANAELVLPYELREKSRLRATLSSGEEAALLLPRGTVLRGGDLLCGDDGRVVKIVAAPEAIYRVECHDADEFARCAYHLGNRHTPVQIIGEVDGHYTLLIREDTVLAGMLEGLGAHVTLEQAPFEPESGAYGDGGGGGHHHHHGDDAGHDHAHAPRIHHAAKA